jgi:hypothetical protein
VSTPGTKVSSTHTPAKPSNRSVMRISYVKRRLVVQRG